MSDLKQCDRCRATAESGSLMALQFARLVVLGDGGQSVSFSRDLCEACQESFTEWLIPAPEGDRKP